MYIESLPLIWVLASILGALLLIFIIFMIIFLLLKNKKTKIVIDDNYISELINAFGGIKNIKEVMTENGGRVAIKVEDLDKLNVDSIKQLASSGVFITGNTVKTLYREDSQAVKNAIEKRM